MNTRSTIKTIITIGAFALCVWALSFYKGMTPHAGSQVNMQDTVYPVFGSMFGKHKKQSAEEVARTFPLPLQNAMQTMREEGYTYEKAKTKESNSDDGNPDRTSHITLESVQTDDSGGTWWRWADFDFEHRLSQTPPQDDPGKPGNGDDLELHPAMRQAARELCAEGYASYVRRGNEFPFGHYRYLFLRRVQRQTQADGATGPGYVIDEVKLRCTSQYQPNDDI